MARKNNFGIYKAAGDTTSVKSSSDISFSVIKTSELTLVESVTTTDTFYVTGDDITFNLAITNVGDSATVVIKNGIDAGIVNVEDYVVGAGTPNTTVKDTDLNALVITEGIAGAGDTTIVIHGKIK
jgi:hypothetical protein